MTDDRSVDLDEIGLWLPHGFYPNLSPVERVSLLIQEHASMTKELNEARLNDKAPAVQITQTICGTLTFFVLVGVALLIFGVIG